MKDMIPYLVDGEIFQIESRDYKGFEKGKKYIPLNINELTTSIPRCVDLNNKIVIETEIKCSDLD